MESHGLLITLGALFFAGLFADQIGRNSWIPRVTLLLLCGLLIGRSGLNIIPAEVTALYPVLSVLALTMVAFLLGGVLRGATLRRYGATILLISGAIVIITVLLVSVGLMLFGVPLELALLLAAIASATAPAATNDVIRQSGVKNDFTQTLSGIVAVDDVWGLIVFSLAVVVVAQMTGTTGVPVHLDALREISGSVLLGVVVGAPAAFLTGRVSDGEPLETEALGLVFLTAGCALWFDLSFLIAGLVAGAVIVNFATHHTRAFHEIEHIQWPFMVLFFLLAGATLDVQASTELGALGALFIGLRVISRFIGGWIGGGAAQISKSRRALFGWALLPQAGVAIGMALVAARQFPQWADQIMVLTVGSTVIFEIVGPIACLMAIRVSQKTAD
ncbi:cation:proton antiporter [Roseobacter sp. YSTF-M11]|uniref:Cation:proton antiporter n=1 Tax=Roseobacter insulae TaxID=2859783 RepID=A0A9X1FRI3_9RHOB|nr:cation:proton antiporter [Roseobacter insulae]MBW4706278.1 cation:proton antiporter [Roseobacter insulae]